MDNPYASPNVNPSTPPNQQFSDEPGEFRSGPEGLGGWLILVAIGLIVTPIRIGFLLVQTYIPLFAEGHWAELTDSSSTVYHPLWGPLIVFEIVGNLAMMICAGIALVLFFRRSPLFPKLMIGFYLAGLAFLLLDFFAGNLIPAVAAQADPDAFRELSRSVIACAIWVPYMLRSRRVRNTFRVLGSP